jgi:hypothetical protein
MTLTIDMPEDEITRLEAKARAVGLSAEEYVRRVYRARPDAATA